MDYETKYVGRFNVDLYEVWDKKKKLLMCNIDEFSPEDKPLGHKSVYLDGKSADIEKYVENEENVAALYVAKEHSLHKIGHTANLDSVR